MTDRLADLAQATAAATVITATQWWHGSLTALQQVPGLPDDGQVALLSKVLEQGGLFVVILVVLYFYRRDFRADKHNQQATINALLHVVQANITTMQEVKAETARMARAAEQQNDRRRTTDRGKE